ncbi:prepilin peptidase [Chelativorans sp. Marseille-P2723]|uniref:A24 family peptidase n=1 Tax=Chelativorans sp. Marseille-P2723 TaxID=2709133 RepID=UPI00156FC539|nr:prepilin peptidase [Chelativorans sp. Marseille-P2723]
MLEAAILVIFPFCMVYAAMSDMISMTIANRVPLLLALSFAAIAPLAGMTWPVIGMHFAAGFAVLAITFCIFALGGMGGGDAKLIAGTTLWFGFSMGLVHYLLFTALAGGALALALMLFRRSGLAVYTSNNVLLRHVSDEEAGVPYGIALGIGGLFAFEESPPMQFVLARLAAH